MKVICAGLSKTGTKSLAEALRVLGLEVHDAPESVTLHLDEWHRVLGGQGNPLESLRTMYRGADAVGDLPPCSMWDTILEAFPESKVILTVRSDEEKWIASLKSQAADLPTFILPPWMSGSVSSVLLQCRILSPSMFKMWSNVQTSSTICFGFFPNRYDEINVTVAKSAYRRHNAFVKSRCLETNTDLLIYNVQEGWAPLCKFLGIPRPDRDFPHLNKDAAITKGEGKHQYREFTERVEKEVQGRFKVIFVLVLMIAFFFVVNYYFL